MQPFDLLCGFMKITFTTRLTELNIQKQRKRQHVTMLCSESNMLPCYAVVTKNLTQTITIKNLNRLLLSIAYQPTLFFKECSRIIPIFFAPHFQITPASFANR